jgi:hypothetical protein
VLTDKEVAVVSPVDKNYNKMKSNILEKFSRNSDNLKNSITTIQSEVNALEDWRAVDSSKVLYTIRLFFERPTQYLMVPRHLLDDKLSADAIMIAEFAEGKPNKKNCVKTLLIYCLF